MLPFKTLFLGILLSASGLAFSSVEETKTERIHIVQIHVGGDDHQEDTFTYRPPSGFLITDIQLHELSKGGDAQYSIASKTQDEVRIHWSVASHTVRGPFHLLINTITSFLTLDMTVNLAAIPSPPASEPKVHVKEQPETSAGSEVGLSTALRILFYNFSVTKLLAYGATVLAGIWAFWCALPNSKKEAFIDGVLQRIRRRRIKASGRKRQK